VVLSLALVRLELFDPVTAILATAPGGIAQIGVQSSRARRCRWC
jgi:uncharacterized membrane protein AbrB (regulator of aidB expression)